MRLDAVAIERNTYTQPVMDKDLADQDLGFYLYTQMAKLTQPDISDAQLILHWNKEDMKARSALKQVAYALGDEAVRRYKADHLN